MNARTARERFVGLLLVVGALASALSPPAAHAGDAHRADDAPWAAAIRAMDEALSKGEVGAALRAREEAHRVALGSRRWEAMADVADATLKLAQNADLRRAMQSEARRAYLSALFWARHQGSLDGVLRVTEAFAALGDREAARQGFVIATALAASSYEPHARERVRALQERLTAEVPLAGGERPAPVRAGTRDSRGAE